MAGWKRGGRMQAKFLTDRGQVRKHNEDAGGIFYNHSGQLLAIIADGMGGHQAGDVASKMAVQLIDEQWKNTEAQLRPEHAEAWLSKALQYMNQKIYERSIANEECHGMGTTVVLAICAQDFISVAHIGDSRCYLLNDFGFTQITEDHSLVNALVQSGEITKDDAQSHPRKNVVLKSLGTDQHVTADIRSISWDQGNQLLLCSDGLSDKVLDDELKSFMQSSDALEKVGQEMVDLANARGGEDNVSLILIQYDALEKAGESSC